MRKIDPKLHEQLVTLISSMGYELVGCETVPQGRQMIFRIYIDSPKGISVDDCSKVSYQVSAMMDVADPFQSKYSLEVSSPGIDRPLFEIEHFQRFVGKQVKLKLYTPVNQRRQFKGVLQRVEDENIYLFVADLEQEIKLSFSNIEKASLIGEVRL